MDGRPATTHGGLSCTSPQERPFETLASGLGGFGTGYDNDLDDGDPLAFSPGDAVSRMLPPLSSLALGPAGMMMGGLSPLLQTLGGILQQLSRALGGSNGSITRTAMAAGTAATVRPRAAQARPNSTSQTRTVRRPAIRIWHSSGTDRARTGTA
ncbi:MAG: hypothetical protein M3R30_07940 [Candidatus Eremiobacteraeota bacterium]|nr:hypothetical protein [Candidatus Eremiobacteraeota bacterium]